MKIRTGLLARRYERLPVHDILAVKLSKDTRIFCRELFHLCLDKGRVQEDRVQKIVEMLLKKQPRYCLQILRELRRLIRLNLAERQAEVQSAVPLTSGSLIEEQLKSLHGQDLEVQFKVKPSLLGGLRIRVGSEVWDGTILERLRHFLVSTPQSTSSVHFIPPIKTSLPEKFKISYSES